MIRFLPDTWRDALLRPLAMGAPDGGVYIEIMAPDIRFAALMVLTLAATVLASRGKATRRPVALLLAFVWLAFVPWLLTTGNGRYFIPILVLAGPLCIALIWQLPMTAGFRALLALVLVGTQGFVLVQNDPRGWWGLAPWTQPYFEIALTPQERDTPATYVLITSISYSLLAPQFHPDSRWLSVASLSGNLESSPDDQRAQRFLAKTVSDRLPLRLFVPTVPAYMNAARQPTEQLRTEINRLLGPHRLQLEPASDCKLLPSRSLARRAFPDLASAPPGAVAKIGFWLCPLQYPVHWQAPPVPQHDTVEVDRVFEQLERSCPRLFQRGEARSVRFGDGFSRTYPSADTKAYVMDNGDVFFKYWRALNANRVGRKDEVLAPGFVLDCNQVKGRSGLPWERVL